MTSDITACYYTANRIPDCIGVPVRNALLESTRPLGIPIVSVSHQPIDLGTNVCVGPNPICVLTLYRQVLIAAQHARTEFVALCEDDCLYPPSHFTSYRPPDLQTFAYNQHKWTVLAWESNPILSNKLDRCVLSQCIAPRLELIAALSERFEHIRLGTLDQDQIDRHFAEPGRYERWMGVTIRNKVQYSDPDPTIIICHLHASIDQLGKRKRHGDIRTQTCNPWGSAEDIIRKYVGEDEWHRERTA